MFEVGDRVYYVSGRHATLRSNPKKGSIHECVGTIDFARGSSLGVKWDNGTHNSYSDIDLIHAKGCKPNPNAAFRIRKHNIGR